MNKIYLVNHCFDVDGGFGDAIPQGIYGFIRWSRERFR